MPKNKVSKLAISSVFFFICLNAFPQLSENAQVSLVTIGPGKEVFTAFGHSALRISDPAIGLDNIYNYGTFSFDNGFYLKFTKGELDFWLSVVPFQREYYSWTVLENRSVSAQVLNLNREQKIRLFGYLENNALPENCVYLYDYFYDNCSNRIDNALKHVLGDDLKFSEETVALKKNTIGSTIRQLTHHYLLQDPWGELGIETCLGIEMDKKISPAQFKFLPDYLMWNYDEAKIISGNAPVPLVQEKISLFKPDERANTFVNHFTPTIAFCIVFGLSLFVSLPAIHRTRLASFFDFLLFFITGTVGVLIIYLWFFTTHHAQCNLNILWANPLNIFLPFLLFSKRPGTVLPKFFLVNGVLLVFTIALWRMLPQQLNTAYLPICLALAIRSLANYNFKKS